MADETEVIPTDRAVSPDGGDEAPDGLGSDEHETPDSGVTNPAKLIRMGTMINQLLSEVRAAPPDAEGLRRLATIHTRTLAELSDVLSEELFDEFEHARDGLAPQIAFGLRAPQPLHHFWHPGGVARRAAGSEGQKTRHERAPRGLSLGAAAFRVAIGAPARGHVVLQSRRCHMQPPLLAASRQHVRVQLREGLSKVESDC